MSEVSWHVQEWPYSRALGARWFAFPLGVPADQPWPGIRVFTEEPGINKPGSVVGPDMITKIHDAWANDRYPGLMITLSKAAGSDAVTSPNTWSVQLRATIDQLKSSKDPATGLPASKDWLHPAYTDDILRAMFRVEYLTKLFSGTWTRVTLK